MPKMIFKVIKEVEVLPTFINEDPVIQFRGECSSNLSPDNILIITLELINDLVTLGEMTMKHHPIECGECHEQVYAKLRSLTLEQLRELVWHSDEAQEVLTEKLKSGMQEYEQKWDDAMKVVKVG